jgi:hypothetical protein
MLTNMAVIDYIVSLISHEMPIMYHNPLHYFLRVLFPYKSLVFRNHWKNKAYLII